jgi:hypothetical protein
MKTHRTRNAVLALTGVVALTLYILACTSFSPDDTKVIYPAFDGPGGAVGIAVYDRETGRSEPLFVPIGYENGITNTVKPRLVRAQWLADGQSITVAWPGGGDAGGDGLYLALLPWRARAPIRLFELPSIEKSASGLMQPLCIVGDRVFIVETNRQILRLDLKTGELVRHELDEEWDQVALLPAPDGTGVFCFGEREEGRTVGRLDPGSFAITSIMTFTNKAAQGSFLAIDRRAQRFAFAQENSDQCELVVLEKGAPVFTRLLGAKGEKWAFGSALFTPRGDALCASFQRTAQSRKGADYGLVEIPLNSDAVRQVMLLSTPESGDENDARIFQAGISHDGSTAAVASTYLACQNGDFKAEDCALFLIDLKDPKWKVTKVAIPMPARRQEAFK